MSAFKVGSIPFTAHPLPSPSFTASACACSQARSRWSRNNSAASRTTGALAFLGLSFTTPRTRSCRYVRQRNHVEQADGLAHEQRDATRVRQLSGLLEVAADPFQVGGDLVAHRALQGLALELRERRPDPVLHLDQVLAARLVARLELQVARHDPVGPGANGGEPSHGVTDRVRADGEWQCRHAQKNTGSRYAP